MKKNAILNSIEIISFKNLLKNLPNGPIMNFSTISRSLEKKKNKQNSQIFTDPKTCAALRLTRIFIIRSGTAPLSKRGKRATRSNLHKVETRARLIARGSHVSRARVT